MKHLYLLLSLLLLSSTYAQTANDTIFFWKAGNMIAKRSINTVNLDSITFKRHMPSPVSMPNVTICAQVWTTKNLDVTTYSDGTPIPQVTSVTAWANLTTGAWCYYNNDPANGAVYGKLYNWYAVAGIYDAASLTNLAIRKKLAPYGWHIPTNTEWTTLTDCLGGLSVAGGKMKEVGILHWSNPNTGATNSSGFSALGGGYLSSTVFYNFLQLTKSSYWWSSSEINSTTAWCRYASSNTASISAPSTPDKSNPFSVRCIKD